MKKIVKLLVSDIDPLGQGVTEEEHSVIFTPKTLPGEEIEAEIINEQKKVSFARLKSVIFPSPLRIKPECQHFHQCGGCDYLHMSYDDEQKAKIKSLQFYFRKIEVPPIEYLFSDFRLYYRNRIQLHYDKKNNLLGILDLEHRIKEIPECKIANPEILKKIKQLYENENWQILTQNEPNFGHIEIYHYLDKIHVNCNKNYASEGFTQVNSFMNEKLVDKVSSFIENDSAPTLLELFAGSGNLTQKIKSKNIICFDIYNKKMENTQTHEFHNLNLYDFHALKTAQKIIPKKQQTLLLDPPRSGLKNIKEWSDAFNFEKIIYVSCNPATLIRDISSLNSSYQITNLALIDLFPSTRHFEVIAVLKKI